MKLETNSCRRIEAREAIGDHLHELHNLCTCGSLSDPAPADFPTTAPAPIILRALSSLFFRRSAEILLLSARSW